MNQILLKIARASILEVFENKNLINKNELIKEYPFLAEERASFVTLKIDNSLRGCIGSIIPQRTLLEDIIYNAKQSAFSDSRFIPLTKDEYSKIEIEISLLTIPEQLNYKNIEDLKNKITKNDGVILLKDDKQATFLPSVWEELSEFERFFGYLCQKAGMNENCLESHPLIYTYQTEIIY